MKFAKGLAFAAVLLVMVAVYAQLWDAPPLTWDDGPNIFNNPYFTMNHWWGIWTEAYYGLYVPIIGSVWAALYYLGGGESWPFHVFNIALHAANTGLVYLFLRGLARRWNLKSPYAPILATAVFAVHPLQVESVAWISGGRDLLSTFFALAAWLVYRRWPRWLGFLAATGLFALALLSKPSVAILPLAVFYLQVLISPATWKRDLLRMLAWSVLAFGAIWLTLLAQIDHVEEKVGWWQRPTIVGSTYRFYAHKLFWPYKLAGNYGLTPHEILGSMTAPWIAFGFLVTGAALMFWAWRRDRRWTVAGGLWLILLLPVSGLVSFAYQNISAVADHYNYLPMLGVAILLLLLWDWLWRWKILALVPVALAAFWAWASFQRTEVWRSDLAFFTDMALTAPDSYNTALGMSVVMCEDLKNYEQGLHWVDKALAAKPLDILALANRAYCLLNSGRRQEVLDMDPYLDRLDHDKLAAEQPTAYSSFLASLGTAMIEEQQYEDGFEYLCEAYRVKPSEPNHTRNLEAATQILRQEGYDPVCGQDEDDGNGTDQNSDQDDDDDGGGGSDDVVN